MKFPVVLVAASCLLLMSACSADFVQRLGYATGTEYTCNEQEPNLPDMARECKEKMLSYEEYQEARKALLSES